MTPPRPLTIRQIGLHSLIAALTEAAGGPVVAPPSILARYVADMDAPQIGMVLSSLIEAGIVATDMQGRICCPKVVNELRRKAQIAETRRAQASAAGTSSALQRKKLLAVMAAVATGVQTNHPAVADPILSRMAVAVGAPVHDPLVAVAWGSPAACALLRGWLKAGLDQAAILAEAVEATPRIVTAHGMEALRHPQAYDLWLTRAAKDRRRAQAD